MPGVEPARCFGQLQIRHLVRVRLRVGSLLVLPGVRTLGGHTTVDGGSRGSIATGRSTVGAWQIPAAWALPLGVTLRMIGIVYLLTLFYLVFLRLRKRRRLRWVLSFTAEPQVGVAERFAVLAKKLHAGRSGC